jgi:hypothetical protein
VTLPLAVFQIWDATGATGLSVLEAVADYAISDVLNDVGALTLTVPKGTVGAEVLLVADDRQVRVLQPGAPDMWFVVDDDAWAGVADAPDTVAVQVACRSLAGVFGEVLLASETSFTAQHPGKIVKDLFATLQGRGGLQNITLVNAASLGSFDSAGVAWSDTLTVTYKAGTSLLTVLKGLSDAQFLDWRMNGRALEVFIPGGDLDRDLTGVFLRPGADVAAAPVQRSRTSVATNAMVVASDGTSSTFSQSLTGRRWREVSVEQPAESTTPAAVLAGLFLAAHAEPDVQLTHDLTDGADTPVPWVDYRCGDRVPTVAAGGGVSLWRVSQIAVQRRPESASASLELGSILQSAEERFADQLARLAPGDRVLT